MLYLKKTYFLKSGTADCRLNKNDEEMQVAHTQNDADYKGFKIEHYRRKSSENLATKLN